MPLKNPKEVVVGGEGPDSTGHGWDQGGWFRGGSDDPGEAGGQDCEGLTSDARSPFGEGGQWAQE